MTEHRQSRRTAVETILSIHLDPNIHAIVLNISDDGLGFHALSAVTQSGPIRFAFSENGQRIEASGELVWTDSTKRTGGLRFASMPRASRERIWNWVDQAAGAADLAKGSPPATARSNEPRESGAALPEVNVPPAPDIPASETPLIPPITPGFAMLGGDQQPTSYTWDQEMSLASSRPKFLRGVVAGAIVTAIIATIVFLAYGSPTALLTQIRARTGGSPASPAVLPGGSPPQLVSAGSTPSGSLEAPVGPAPPDVAVDSKAAGAPAGAQTQATQPRSDAHVASSPGSVPLPKADTGDADLALADRYLRDKAGPSSSVAAAHFLWSAVQKGNVSAEIALADLYARGDGVTKSCNQARVLLRAAAGKGSSTASLQLAQIARTGCR